MEQDCLGANAVEDNMSYLAHVGIGMPSTDEVSGVAHVGIGTP